jgi:Kdo2-lipid IVA lauroyltransferase/acyltransferase
MHRIGFYLYFILFRPFLWLPLRVWYALADVLYLIMYKGVKYRKKVIIKNLKKSFPHKDSDFIETVTRKFYRHLADYFVESLKMETFTKKRMMSRCVFKNIHLLEDAKKEGKDIIVFLGHYGNWEFNTSLPLWFDNKFLTVYRPLKNVYFDRYFLKIRCRFGVEPIPMDLAAREILSYHNRDIRTISGLISDQNPSHFDQRYWVRFLNHDTAVYEGGEKIARKINASVFYFKMKKVKRGFYETEIIPMFDDAGKTERHEITRKYFELLEDTITEQPELWLWSHKRWKKEMPEGFTAHPLRKHA